MLFAVLLFLLNEYTLNALAPLLNKTTIVGLWLLPSLSLLLLFYALMRIQVEGMSLKFKLSAHVLLVYFSSLLVMVTVLLLTDIVRLVVAVAKFFIDQQGFVLMSRPTFTGYAALLLGFLLVLAFLYGILKGKYAYRLIKHQLFFKDLPPAFDGFRIVQISDIHAGSLNNSNAIQKGIDLITKQNADLFVFTGDLVNNKAEEIVPFMEHFSQIKAPYGQFSILGNHDYGDYIAWPNEASKLANLEQLKKYHAQIGFRLLLDEYICLQKDQQRLYLLGVENWGLGFGQRGNLNRALADLAPNDFKILLSHDPTHWEAEVKNHPSNIALTLSGHTHGMQFGIELFGWKWSPVQFRYKHWAGIKEENGRIININRGFGFLGFSGRVGIWPEVSLIELRRG